MPRTFGKLQRSITWRKGAHTTYPGSFGKADCGRLTQENSTLRNKSNFDILKKTVLDTQTKKLHPDSQELQHLPSHRQQKLQIPGPTSATRLSHQLSTTLQCCRNWLYRIPLCQIQQRRTIQSPFSSFRLLHHACSTPGFCDRYNNWTISTPVPPFLRGKIRSNNSCIWKCNLFHCRRIRN